jgi:hypothetical protein
MYFLMLCHVKSGYANARVTSVRTLPVLLLFCFVNKSTRQRLFALDTHGNTQITISSLGIRSYIREKSCSAQ